MTRGPRQWAALAAALLLLDASLTFENLWPTPVIRWNGELSIELAACVMVLMAAGRWLGRPSRRVIRWLAAFWVMLVVARYVDVTAPALYGRDINLYWDLRFVPAVAAMLARAAPVWLSALVVAGAALALTLIYILLRWALGRLGEATIHPGERRALAAVAAGLAALFVAQHASARVPAQPKFARPVVQVYARQMWLVTGALAGSTSIAASPSMSSDLSLVKHADVLLFFIESYGAVSYERPEFASRLAPRRAAFEAAIKDTGRDVVSAFVESPTFGGSSWFAHLTLLSGIEVRDPDTNARLMTEKRDTLVQTFARQGYRTIAVMPGIWHEWPEGAFYGFDEIYGGERLDYRGPDFGWWSIPDQFALARLDALEVARQPRAPLFVVFPTISTHTPFTPTPPYQADWARMLTHDPYNAADLERAYDQQPDWMDLGPSYVDALSYAYATLSGYLRARPDHDFVMILLGDHQPPALVSGEGAPWDVPVHVITNRRQLLDRLVAAGFRGGLTPSRPALGPMHALLPVLLDAFGERR